MSFDFVMVILVLARSYWHHRTCMDKLWTGQRLMNVLVRDSMFYFLWSVISLIYFRHVYHTHGIPSGFSMYLFNTLVWLLLPTDYWELGTTWVIVILPSAATRLVLNLREEYYGPSPPQTKFSSVIMELHNLSKNSKGKASPEPAQV